MDSCSGCRELHLFSHKKFVCVCPGTKGVHGVKHSAAFWKFRGAYPGSLSDAYGIYKSACGMNNDSATDRQARASLSSTGFSGRSAVEVEEMGITHSPTQRRLARENGISYREYASLLGDVPSGDRLKKNR